MTKIIANAILFGKINYHLLIWPLINNNNLKKVNKIIENVARTVYGAEHLGRTFEFVLKKLNWFKIEDLHEMAIIKFNHKLLNRNENHYLKDLITQNRFYKTFSENKIGPISNNSKNLQNKIALGTLEVKSVMNKSLNIYNKLPRELTLIVNKNNFKKWLKKYYLNKDIKFTKIDKDFTEIKIDHDYFIDQTNIDKCSFEYKNTP